VEITVTQGAIPFRIADTFTFTTAFNYDEYRGSLAAPDCMSFPGRSAATMSAPYALTLEEAPAAP
jgi:hypothetical protein